jgi:LacI family transcriptional regulator
MADKLTIQDIARLAGVSKATVSRVLNQKPDVDPETRQRILRIMDEQGFVPSITASGLAGGRTRMVGVLVPSLTWPFIPEIVQGVAEVVEKSSYELLLYSIPPNKDRVAALQRILDTKLTAGLLVIVPGQALPRLKQLREEGMPVVVIDDQHLPADVPWVGADNRLGAYNAVRHLISLGHRRIAHIQGPLSYQCSHERYQGYTQALLESGITPEPELLVQGDFEIAGGRACARQLFELENRPTAIFAGNDHMAWGVLEEAESARLRVPDDVAVVGFDDTVPSSHKRPPLTTVRQPFHEMGQRAAEVLLWLVDSPRPVASGRQPASALKLPLPAPVPLETVRIQLPTSLIVRQSCGADRLEPAPLRYG